MKRQQILFTAALLSILTLQQVFSQGVLLGLDYNISYPTADTKDFTSDPSYKGIAVGSRGFLKPNFSAGILLAWHTFEQKTDQTLQLKDGSVQGEQTRILRSYPFFLNAHYYLGQEHKFRLYIGTNAGVYFINQQVESGNTVQDKSNWHFGLAPEAGFLIPLGWYANIHLNVRYNYGFTSGESITGEALPLSYWGISIGLAYFYSSLF